MPIHEYGCKCGVEREVFHTSHHAPSVHCPNCGNRMKRQISMTAKPVVLNYWSENLGAQITGRKQKSQVMESMGVVERG